MECFVKISPRGTLMMIPLLGFFLIILDGTDNCLESFKHVFEQCERQSNILFCLVDLVSCVYVEMNFGVTSLEK